MFLDFLLEEAYMWGRTNTISLIVLYVDVYIVDDDLKIMNFRTFYTTTILKFFFKVNHKWPFVGEDARQLN